MRFTKSILLVLIVPLLAFTAPHKYHVSVTQINYVKDKASVQIITRVFTDDLEYALRKRYDESITLSGKNEAEPAVAFIQRYLNEKIKIKINNNPIEFKFIGKDYENDIMRCYLEIEDVKAINSIQITNQFLFDLFEEQQNIIKLDVDGTQKSYLFTHQKDTATLNIN